MQITAAYLVWIPRIEQQTILYSLIYGDLCAYPSPSDNTEIASVGIISPERQGRRFFIMAPMNGKATCRVSS